MAEVKVKKTTDILKYHRDYYNENNEHLLTIGKVRRYNKYGLPFSLEEVKQFPEDCNIAIKSYLLAKRLKEKNPAIFLKLLENMEKEKPIEYQ